MDWGSDAEQGGRAAAQLAGPSRPLRPRTVARLAPVRPLQRAIRLLGDGAYCIELPESSLCLESLVALFGAKAEEVGLEVKLRGELRFERTSSCQTHAASVVFRHYRIGYLPQTEARALYLACQRTSVLLAPLAVQLLVKDGLRRANKTAGTYRVRVDAAKPFRFG